MAPPLAFIFMDAATDLPAVARCFPGDTAFATVGADDGRSWQVQKRAVGNAWVEVTPGGGSSPTASPLPTPDNTLNLGGPSNAWAVAYIDGGIVCKDANLSFDVAFAGASQVSFGNSSVGAGRTCTISTDGTVQWQNGGTGISAFTFDGVPTGSRVITWQDASGTVPFLGTPQTWTAAQSFEDATIPSGLSVRFVSGGSQGALGSAALTSLRTWLLPDVSGNIIVDAGAQTMSSKTLARGVVQSSSVAAILALTSPGIGEMAFAADGRKPGEGPGSGSGVPAFWDGAGWFSSCDGTTLAA